MFITVEDAIEIVLGLAKENILREDQCDDEQMETDRQRQIESCNVIEDFFTNVVSEGRVMPLNQAEFGCAEVKILSAQTDRVTIVEIDTPDIDEDDNGPMIRVYLNDNCLFENPKYGEVSP